MTENNSFYIVKVIGPDKNIIHQTKILGLVAASEYLEEQLQNLSDDYWGHMAICNNENNENNENNDKI